MSPGIADIPPWPRLAKYHCAWCQASLEDEDAVRTHIAGCEKHPLGIENRRLTAQLAGYEARERTGDEVVAKLRAREGEALARVAALEAALQQQLDWHNTPLKDRPDIFTLTGALRHALRGGTAALDACVAQARAEAAPELEQRRREVENLCRANAEVGLLNVELQLQVADLKARLASLARAIERHATIEALREDLHAAGFRPDEVPSC